MSWFSDDIVEEKAFEFAIRDGEFRRKRIAELQKAVGAGVIGAAFVLFVPVLVLWLGWEDPNRIGKLIFAFGMLLSSSFTLWRSSCRYAELKLLKFHDIQQRIEEGREEKISTIQQAAKP